MSIIKSFSVGNGDTFYISHGSDNFTVIDCNLTEEDQDILEEIKKEHDLKGISRFISTHPDEDHFKGIELLDNKIKICNFYVVKNKVKKSKETTSFKHYCKLRDGKKAFYLQKDITRKWMNESDETRGSAGINILWPDLNSEYFKEALEKCEENDESPNNISTVIRYKLKGGASFLWIGDLETPIMEKIVDQINLEKTTIVFASHHGRDSGKIPNSWLKKLDPQIIVIGEAPSRHLNYYTGYETITQNTAKNITFNCIDNKVHIYSSDENYKITVEKNRSDDEKIGNDLGYYKGSITVETIYTLD